MIEETKPGQPPLRLQTAVFVAGDDYLQPVRPAIGHSVAHTVHHSGAPCCRV